MLMKLCPGDYEEQLHQTKKKVDEGATNSSAYDDFTDEEAQQIFVLFDADSSGSVDINELVVFVKAIKGRDEINPAAVSEVWDKDNSGEVTALTAV